MAPNSLGEIIKKIRVPVVAKACGCSPRAIYKWIANGSLPENGLHRRDQFTQKNRSRFWRPVYCCADPEVSKPKSR